MRWFRRTAPARVLTCTCPEHVERLAETTLPCGPQSVATLVAAREIGAALRPEEPWHPVDEDDQPPLPTRHWSLWFGPTLSQHLDPVAGLALERALMRHPWITVADRETTGTFHVQAPNLCSNGLMAVAVRALTSPGVLPEPAETGITTR